MNKRVAQKQLTMDNYDLPDEDDSNPPPGPPKMADEETLKSRKILKPKRRLDDSSGGDGGKSNALSGFKGFSSTQPASEAFKGFSFASTFGSSSSSVDNAGKTMISTNLPTSLFKFGTPATNGTSTNATATNSPSIFAKPLENSNKSPVLTTTITKAEETTTTTAEDKETTFKTEVKALNEIFFNHITKFMAESKLYNFTVVCEEYIKHFRQLQEKKNAVNDTSKSNEKVEDKTKFNFTSFNYSNMASQANVSSSSFGTASTLSNLASNSSSLGEAPKFGTSSATPATGLFSFSANPSASTMASSIPSFQFKPIQVSAPATGMPDNQTKGTEAEENEEPPKVESFQHKEANAVFTKKCKLYYQKDGQFVEKSIGFLYIKVSPDDSAKPQLLIRSDTSTGNILLNIALMSSLPIVKAEKKGVMITCVPNPPLEVKKKKENEVEEEKKETTTFLIRVKQTDVDELFDTLVKHKGQ